MFVPRNEIQPEKLDELSERRIMAYDSELMLVEVSLKKNGVGATHTHPHHQVDYLVSGRVEFNLNGEKRILLPGDSVVIPPNLPHGAFADNVKIYAQICLQFRNNRLIIPCPDNFL